MSDRASGARARVVGVRALGRSACFGALVVTLAAGLARRAAADEPAAAADEVSSRLGAVLDFAGPNAARVRRGAVAAAELAMTLVPEAEVRAAAERLGVDLETAEGVARVATELQLSAIVRGTVTGAGRRARVQIRVLGAAGDELAMEEAELARGRAAEGSARAATETALTRALAAVAAREAAARPAVVEQTRDVEEAPAARSTADASRDASGAGHRVSVRVGPVLRTRKARVTLPGGDSRRYTIGGYLELLAEVEARPFAGSEGALRGLWARGGGAMAVSLSSENELGDELETSERRFFLDAGYLASAGPVEVGGAIGFAYEKFEIATNPTLPSAKYPALRLLVLARLPVVDDAVVLRGEGGVRLAFTAGKLGDAFGDGAAPMALEGALGVEGRLGPGFSYALDAGYHYFWMTFDGSAGDVAAERGRDSGFTVATRVGWAF